MPNAQVGKHRRTGSHRGLTAAVITAFLAVSGATCVGVAIARPEGPPQPPLAATGTFEPPARELSPASPRSEASPHSAQGTGPVLAPSVPRSIAIPKIGVRSPLLSLGLDPKGAMETPEPGPNYNKAGWYRNSPTPGSLGPAVIAGHVDSAKEGPSVFFRLGSLRPHDTILIARADGTVAVFAVDSVRRYPKSQFPSQFVYGNTDHAALRLITCGGPFDRRNRNYLDNIVVFASLVRAA